MSTRENFARLVVFPRGPVRAGSAFVFTDH